MVDQAASDYSQYLQKIDVSKEINPLCTSIEEMLARLEEFESLLSTVKADSNLIIQNNVQQISEFQNEFNDICKRIDNLEKFINLIKINVDEMDNKIDIAENELNVTNYSIKGLLKPFLLNKIKNSNTPEPTNLQDDGQYKRLPIFNTSDYFTDNSNNKSELNS